MGVEKTGNTAVGKTAWVAGGVFLGLALGLGLLFLLGGGRNWFQGNPIPPAVPEVNAPAPDFSLQNLAGETVHLSGLRGRSLALNFWATWCGPCQLEMPLLQQAQERYPADLLVLAINNDEPQAKVQAFADDFGLNFPVLLDPGAKVTEQYRVRGFPTTLFIDPDGIIRYEHIGVLNQSTLDGYLEDLGVAQ